MTGRGWWVLLAVGVMLLVGVFREVHALVVTAFTLLLWLGWQWLFFTLRLRLMLPRLRLDRQVRDDRGPLTTLWAGRDYTVAVTLRALGESRLGHLTVFDPVPFSARHVAGRTSTDGEVGGAKVLALEYDLHCPLPGLARFEGVRIEISDLQGFFAHVTFLRDPVEYRILPGVLVRKSGGPVVKRDNELPPPGIHRLHQPGSGSELLDLRDYVPGDPPRTIAWKVSARRDKLITKEFESEVPIRCTLFVDVSSSVRVASPTTQETGPAYFKPLDRIIDLCAGVIRASLTLRDLAGLCLFDENQCRALVRPARTLQHQNRLMETLGEAAGLGPLAPCADPEKLLPIAFALARELYPDLLRNEVNRVPEWLIWLVGFPGVSRHGKGLFTFLHRRKRLILFAGTTLVPLGLVAGFLLLMMAFSPPAWAQTMLGGLVVFGIPLAVLGGWLAFLSSLLSSGRRRKLARWRKQLAALFALGLPATGMHADAGVGALEALMEDDDLFSLHLQSFLAAHQVPVALPLYDDKGRFLFRLPGKIDVLAAALRQAIGRGRDNELFVLLVDLLELDDALDPLLQAVRVAVARHHQVLLILPWPEGVPLPEQGNKRDLDPRQALARGLMVDKYHDGFDRIRVAFARLGVSTLCAASETSLPIILKRLEQLRAGGARRR